MEIFANLGVVLVVYGPAIVLGYLLGSIPFGLVITKLAGLGDIRAIGSGNIGATNVLRTGRKDLALATLLLIATVRWHERMHSPAKLVMVELSCLQAVEFVDVGRNGKAHAATASGVRDW